MIRTITATALALGISIISANAQYYDDGPYYRRWHPGHWTYHRAYREHYREYRDYDEWRPRRHYCPRYDIDWD